MKMYRCGTSAWRSAKDAGIFAALLLTIFSCTARAQDWLKPVPQFPLAASDLTIRQHAEAGKPFTVAGQCGAFLGEQDGSFEAWIFPVKLLSAFKIEAEVEGYSVPIDVNEHAAEIEVAPDHTTITYSHIAFTVKEILFATRCGSTEQAGAGVMALFEIESVRPMTLTFSFTPEVRRMWPAPNYGPPSPEWVGDGVNGYYILHADSPDIAGAIAMPGTHPGILAPYQEKPKTYPLQMVLNFDPKRDSGRYFPLAIAVGSTAQTATKAALAENLAKSISGAAALYSSTADYYAHFFDRRLTIETPDKQLDRAIKWAELSIDQLQVRHGNEIGLVAGFYSSGDSARPGFGWYFGRDTLFTLIAVDSYGDFKLTRDALVFLMQRQRADGKMMHEYSQTADLVDWNNFPYEYAAADATPLFLMDMEDYVNTSGDVDFLRSHWDAVEKAWNFERNHDSDGDGIYDNAQGTGWVESWPSGMPHQEIYLAALDQQASGAMARLSIMMGKADLAQAAQTRAEMIAEKIESEYGGSMYAFSRNADGSLDKTATIYPSIAWWDGHYALKQPDAMFSRWASHEFSTDWGTRDLSEDEKFYDPISYHQGSVWPLFTGWASLAEYRTGRSLSGYAHLMQNADLTWQQDLGAVTELLSGAYFVPFGRSTTHQLWSSAMVITPAVRGLFGLSFDAEHKTITIDPHLPAEWPGATLHNAPVAGGTADLVFHRERGTMVARLEKASADGVILKCKFSEACRKSSDTELKIKLPAVEVGIPSALPLPGAATAQLKVLKETPSARSLSLVLEAQGGSSYDLPLRLNSTESAKVSVEGGGLITGILTDSIPRLSEWWSKGGSSAAGNETLQGLHVEFPAGAGYQKQRVRLSW